MFSPFLFSCPSMKFTSILRLYICYLCMCVSNVYIYIWNFAGCQWWGYIFLSYFFFFAYAPDSCFNDWFIVSIFGWNRIKETCGRREERKTKKKIHGYALHMIREHYTTLYTRDGKQWNSRTMKVSLRKIVNTATAAAEVGLVKFWSACRRIQKKVGYWDRTK